MKITTERVGDSVVLTLDDGGREITVLLETDTAATLGANLVMQSALDADVLDLPESFRPTKEV